MSRRAGSALFALVCVWVLTQKVLLLRSWNWTLFDTRIYLDATRQALAGAGNLYTGTFGDGWPFTYPPFAVLAFAPLAKTTESLATAALTATSVLALARICWLTSEGLVAVWAARHGAVRNVAAAVPLMAALTMATASQSDSVAGTLAFGQINLVMAWLVVEDYLGLGRSFPRAGGALVGLAAGIKVTPALAAVPHLFTRGRSFAVRALAMGAATVGLSAVLLPHEVAEYFTEALWDTKRPGQPEQEWNQSIAGMCARLLHDTPGAGAVRWLLVLLALVTGVYLAAVLLRRDDRLGACLTVFVTTGSVSPISWYHHLVLLPLFAVWAITALPTMARAFSYAVAGQAGLLGLWVMVGAYQYVPRDNGAEWRHGVIETVVSEAVPMLSLTVVVTLALGLWRAGDRALARRGGAHAL